MLIDIENDPNVFWDKVANISYLISVLNWKKNRFKEQHDLCSHWEILWQQHYAAKLTVACLIHSGDLHISLWLKRPKSLQRCTRSHCQHTNIKAKCWFFSKNLCSGNVCAAMHLPTVPRLLHLLQLFFTQSHKLDCIAIIVQHEHNDQSWISNELILILVIACIYLVYTSQNFVVYFGTMNGLK